MYKSLTANDFKSRHELSEDYSVSGFLVYGTYKKQPYEDFRAHVLDQFPEATFRSLPTEFLAPILEANVNGKIYWFVAAYGGTLLSEWLHIACLMGSECNLFIGTSGGLLKGSKSGDVVIPTATTADESSTRAYGGESVKDHEPNPELSQKVYELLSPNLNVLRGPTITFQAMLAETWEMIVGWSDAGYYAVEMEAATIFAVSNHFNVPSTASIVVSDMIIEEETVLHENYEETRQLRQRVMSTVFATNVKLLLES